MIRKFAPALVALTLVSGAGAAFASPEVDAATQEQIRAKLTAEGYEVRKIDMEDGQIEVYALKDGARLEIYLDASLNVVGTKVQD